MQENIQNAIQEAIENAPERKFVESFEMAITLKDVDLKNPVNRIQEEVRLPSGRGKDVRIAMFAGSEMAAKARAAGINVIDPATIEDLGGNRQQADPNRHPHQRTPTTPPGKRQHHNHHQHPQKGTGHRFPQHGLQGL